MDQFDVTNLPTLLPQLFDSDTAVEVGIAAIELLKEQKLGPPFDSILEQATTLMNGENS